MRYTETYTSCLHTHVRFHIYEPSIVLRVKGIIQIHHGLCEHCDRYDHFASFLSNHGYVVIVSDFVGHGKSLIDFEQGFFGLENGSEGLVKDMFHLYDVIRLRYQEAPYYLMGTDLGALLIRKFLCEYGEYVQGAILLATSGSVSSRLASLELRLLKLIKGPMYRSKSVFKHFHNSLDSMFNNKKLEWMTRDEHQREAYLEDPMTHFIYTVKGYEDILNTLKEVNSNDCILNTPDYLSIYIGVGSEDKLTVDSKLLYNRYKLKGISDVTYQCFEGFRHSLLFEKDNLIVYNALLKWLDERKYI